MIELTKAETANEISNNNRIFVKSDNKETIAELNKRIAKRAHEGYKYLIVKEDDTLFNKINIEIEDLLIEAGYDVDYFNACTEIYEGCTGNEPQQYTISWGRVMIMITGRRSCIGLGLARKYRSNQEQLNKVEVVEEEFEIFIDCNGYNKLRIKEKE